jgi:NDP-sugar pyrophosphorylase family protein
MAKLGDLTAAVLVGGLGTRLRPVVADCPKVLAQIHGRPFLSYLLDQLHNADIRKVVLCTGYLAEAVRSTFGEDYRGMSLAYSEETTPLGTGGALRAALPWLRSNPVLVLNGDSYCETDLGAFRAFFDERRAAAALRLVEVDDVGRFGQVRVNDADEIVAFEEKGSATGRGWINAGVYLFATDALRLIPSADRPVSLEKEMFPSWLGQGLLGFRQPGRFIDIGTPESYREADAFFGSC